MTGPALFMTKWAVSVHFGVVGEEPGQKTFLGLFSLRKGGTVIRSIVRSAVVLVGAVTLVGGLVGQGRAAADGGVSPGASTIQVAGNDFETYDDDDDGHRRYRCYDGYSSYDDGGYYRSYDYGYDDYGYYDSYDHRYRDRCRRYYDDHRYYYDRGDHDGDHDGDRDFPDRRRGRNHDHD